MWGSGFLEAGIYLTMIIRLMGTKEDVTDGQFCDEWTGVCKPIAQFVQYLVRAMRMALRMQKNPTDFDKLLHTKVVKRAVVKFPHKIFAI